MLLLKSDFTKKKKNSVSKYSLSPQNILFGKNTTHQSSYKKTLFIFYIEKQNKKYKIKLGKNGIDYNE
jgi:hypothetical protein